MDHEMAAYLDRALSPDRQRDAEAHFADCYECRQRLLNASRAVSTAPGSGSAARRVLPWAGLAAAAVAALLLVQGPGAPPVDPLLRDDGQRTLIRAIDPGPGESVSQPVRFVWHSVGPEVRYRLTVTTTEGVEIWTHEGSDTVAVQPTSPRWRSNQTYMWYVDALLDDGTSVTTGVTPFAVEP